MQLIWKLCLYLITSLSSLVKANALRNCTSRRTSRLWLCCRNLLINNHSMTIQNQCGRSKWQVYERQKNQPSTWHIKLGVTKYRATVGCPAVLTVAEYGEHGEQLLAVQQQWLLQNTVSNCWLCSSNGCYRIWWATAGCAAAMAVTEYGEQLLAVQQQWLLQSKVSNCWLCSSNGCYRLWWANAGCAAVMAVTEYD